MRVSRETFAGFSEARVITCLTTPASPRSGAARCTSRAQRLRLTGVAAHRRQLSAEHLMCERRMSRRNAGRRNRYCDVRPSILRFSRIFGIKIRAQLQSRAYFVEAIAVAETEQVCAAARGRRRRGTTAHGEAAKPSRERSVVYPSTFGRAQPHTPVGRVIARDLGRGGEHRAQCLLDTARTADPYTLCS
jgi:hypothetical protein